jgi:hypothetical protein
VACAEARPILAFLAATPFVASDWFFDSQARLSPGRPGFSCNRVVLASSIQGLAMSPGKSPAADASISPQQDRHNRYSMNEHGKE